MTKTEMLFVTCIKCVSGNGVVYSMLAYYTIWLGSIPISEKICGGVSGTVPII